MNSRLNPEEQALYRAVDEVLHYVWDPIGISSIPQARDEYHSYLPQVFSLLRSGATEAELDAHLASIASDRMGLANALERSNEAAAVLVDWRGSIGG